MEINDLTELSRIGLRKRSDICLDMFVNSAKSEFLKTSEGMKILSILSDIPGNGLKIPSVIFDEIESCVLFSALASPKKSFVALASPIHSFAPLAFPNNPFVKLVPPNNPFVKLVHS